MPQTTPTTPPTDPQTDAGSPAQAGSPARTDVLVIGAGLAGLVAAAECLRAGRSVTIVDQEGAVSIGGQAFFSFGGLFLVDSPEQRRLGIHDSHALAQHDWAATAGFDRDTDARGREWADAYVAWAAGGKRDWLRSWGIRLFPVVGHAERGDLHPEGHGNSVPRFHIVWGTGPAIVAPFSRAVRDGVEAGLAHLRFRHRVDDLIVEDGRVVGASGSVLAPDLAIRGEQTNRAVTGTFELRADHVVVATGGIGGTIERVREHWPERLGTPPNDIVVGVPAHVDGRGIGIAHAAGASIVNDDRMWHYTEGIRNWDPIWPNHGIRILPGPSSLWFDSAGHRLPAPCYPGFDTLSTLEHLRRGGHEHSWFVLTRSIVEKEFTLSGSEQNPDLTDRSLRLLAHRVLPGAPAPVQAFLDHGEDFVQADTLDELLDAMEAMEGPVDRDAVRLAVEDHDADIANPSSSDPQIRAIHEARRYIGDRLIRVAPPHRMLDEAHGPLIAVRLRTLTRKTLGGIETDLDSRALDAQGLPIPGLLAVGEAAGFGGGGVHGYRSLEGTFLGGCMHTGLRAARHITGATQPAA